MDNNAFSRRTFLGAGAAAVAASPLAAVPVAASTIKPADAVLKGRVYKAVKGIGRHDAASAEAKFQEYRDMGFDGMESGNPAHRDAYHAATAKTGFQFHGVVCPGHWSARLSHPDAKTRAKGLANLERSIRNVHVLGGSSVLLVPGKVAGAKETHDHVWNRSIAEVKKVLPLCSRFGVRVLIETVWNGFCEDPEKFRDYVDAFNSPWVGAYFDIGNMQKFAPAHDWIRILGARTVKLDVKDWGRKNGFCRLGEGDVDWDKVRAELLKIGFTGWATREGRDKDLKDTSKLMDQLMLGVS